jgi:hypothetical protein
MSRHPRRTSLATTQLRVILFGVGVLTLGCLAFLLWSWRTNRRPVGVVEAML